ncbi:MAG: HAD-IA family hydrolase [Roseicyclus sp.]
MTKTVIFDLDGTLADTAGDLIAAANAAVEALGHSAVLRHGPDDATAFRGGRAMLRLAADRLGEDGDLFAERGYGILLDAYGAAIDGHTRLYPGMVAAVERLRESGAAVGICTNKPEALALRLIARLGIAPLFDGVVGADTLPVRKPDAAPFLEAVARSGGAASRAILVGDTETDRKTAAAAGVPCVLVTFGPEGDSVARWAPEALLHHYDELDTICARLLP